jgi:hypothetical protein
MRVSIAASPVSLYGRAGVALSEWLGSRGSGEPPVTYSELRSALEQVCVYVCLCLCSLVSVVVRDSHVQHRQGPRAVQCARAGVRVCMCVYVCARL